MQVLETAIAYWRSASLFLALKLNLFEKLGESHLSVEEILSSCDIKNPEKFLLKLENLLLTLTAMKIVEREEDKYFFRPEILEQLIAGREKTLYHFAQAICPDFFTNDWQFYFEDREGNSNSMPSITNEKTADKNLLLSEYDLIVQSDAEALGKYLDLSKYQRMLELTCDAGIFSLHLCKKNPHLQSTIFPYNIKDIHQLAVTIDIIKKMVEENELDERIEVLSAKSFGETSEMLPANTFELAIFSNLDQSANSWFNVNPYLKENGLIVIRGYFTDIVPPKEFPVLYNFFKNRINGYAFPTISRMKDFLLRANYIDIRSHELSEFSSIVTARKPEFKK